MLTGHTHGHAPPHAAEQSVLSCVEVDYISLPGWCKSTAGTRSFSDLPVNAQNYVTKIQELLGIPSKPALSPPVEEGATVYKELLFNFKLTIAYSGLTCITIQ